MISGATPEKVEATIIPGMLVTNWRLVSDTPHQQIYERRIDGFIAKVVGELDDGPGVASPVVRSTFTIVQSGDGVIVEGKATIVMAQGSAAERTEDANEAYDSKVQRFLDSVKAKIAGESHAAKKATKQ